jgi:hypothetical protein
MVPLLVLLLLGVYLWVAYKVVRRINPNWGKALAVAVFVLIPTADAVYGRIKLKQLCEAEGGVRIYRTVEGVEGFYDERWSPDPEWLTNYGFRFLEGKGPDGNSLRIKLGPDRKVFEERNVVPESRYQYEYSGAEFGNGYFRGESRIRDLQTKEILSRYVDIIYQGGWAERFLSYDGGPGFAAFCKDVTDQSPIGHGGLISRTLKPAK